MVTPNQDRWAQGAPQVPAGFYQWSLGASEDLDGILPFKVNAAGANPLGGAVVASSNNWGGWSFPDAAVSGISYERSYPLNWETAVCTWGYVPLTAVSGNIRWRFRVYRTNVLGVAGDLISDAPAVDVSFSKAADAQFVMGHVFNVAAAGENSTTGFDLHNSDSFVGEVVNITIERVGNDALDTYNGGNVLFTNFSIDRLT